MKNIVESFPSTQDLIKNKNVLFTEILNTVKQEGLVIFTNEERFNIDPKENIKLSNILNNINKERPSISIPSIDKLQAKIKDESPEVNLKSDKKFKV